MNSPEAKRFYGMYIAGACFVTMFFCWGMVLNTFPVFVKPITEELGWTRGSLAIASLAGAVSSILLFPVAGKLIDRTGVRAVMIAGAFAMGLGLSGGSQMSQLWHFFVVNALIGCGLACTTIVPCSFVISTWFVARRGTAMSVALLGTAVGGMIMAPVATWITVNFSWRIAWIFAGSQILVFVIPTVFFLIRTRPSDMGLEPYRDSSTETDAEQEAWGIEVRDAFSSPAFWQISTIILIVGVVTGGVGYHCVAHLSDIGHSPERATFAWSVVMGGMIAGKLSTGPIADRWGVKNTAAAVCVVFAVTMVLLRFSDSYSIALAFAVVYGFALGAPLVLNPLLAGDYLGMKNFGALFGILNVMGTIGGNAGPIGAGFFYDSQETYLPLFYLFAALMAVAAICALFMKPISDLSRAAGRIRSSEVTR